MALTRRLPGIDAPGWDESLEAFQARDLSRCGDLYVEGAGLEFATTHCRNRPELEKWHRDRFNANLQLLQIDLAKVEGGEVIVEGVITSDRLKAWRIGTLPVRARFAFQGDKIASARFGLRT